MFDLTGKVAFVTGGCGLIGKAVIEALEVQGANVINLDIRAEHPFDCNDTDRLDAFLHSFNCHIFVNCFYPRNLRTHLLSFLGTSETAAAYMASHGGGSIINFGSIYGIVGADHRLYEGTEMNMPHWYAAAKGGIIALSRSLATEYGHKGVRVNCISPGGVYDDQPGLFVRKYCARVPMKRMATPADIVGGVVFLASDESKYITGINLVIDGGLTAL